MFSQKIQADVGKKKQEAQSNVRSWFMGKFSKKTQYIRHEDEETAAARMRQAKQYPQTSYTSKQTYHNATPQDQQKFLRGQLLEMKRDSERQKKLEEQAAAERKKKAEEASLEEKKLEEEKLDPEVKDEEPSNQEEDKEDAVPEKVEEVVLDTKPVIIEREVKKQNSMEKVDSLAIELERRMTAANQLYAEALNHFENAMNPQQTMKSRSSSSDRLGRSSSNSVSIKSKSSDTSSQQRSIPGKKGSNKPKSEWL